MTLRKIFLVRHGRTYFNIANDSEYKGKHTEKLKQIWKNEDFIDTKLHPSAYEQLEKTAGELQNTNFSHVFISPMFRTQQTAEFLFKNRKDNNQTKFILFPSIAEIFVTIGELQLKNTVLSNFDSSLIHDKNGGNWQMQLFKKSSRYEEFLNLTKGSQESKVIIQAYQQMIDKYFPLAAIESIKDLSNRINSSKQEITKYLQNDTHQQTNICIVSHWATLKCFTATWIKNAHESDGIDFVNGEAKSFDQSILSINSKVI